MDKTKQKVEYKVLMEGEKEDPDGYLDSFPPGYRFCPTDEELIIHYLKPKNLKQSVPISCMKTVNDYECSPQELTETFKLHREKEWYFFTRLNLRFPDATRQNQKAVNECWKDDGVDKEIYSDSQLVGYKKSLFFEEGSSRSSTGWEMEEFKVPKESGPSTSSTENVKQDDWILSKIYKTISHMPSKENNNLQQNEVPNAGPKMQNEDPLHLFLGHHSPGLQSSSSKVSACGEDYTTEETVRYLDSLPPGYRFCPTDEELFVHYVKPMNLFQPLPINKIKIVYLYRYHPKKLTETYKPLRENEWYFFTKTSLKGEGESKKIQNRITVNGSWEADKGVKQIYSNGQLFGFKRRFTFYERKLTQSTATNWIMYQYKLDQENASTRMGHQEMKLSGWVLCNIHNSQANVLEKKRKRIHKGIGTAMLKKSQTKFQ